MELATFRGDDEACLVRAALACPACLSGSVEWSLQLDDWGGGQAECACRECGHRHTVSLNGQQALRLYLEARQPLPA